MTKTEHYQLPQWERTDQVKMSDFNEAFAALETALAGKPQIVVGTYEGTGEYGQDKPNSIEFPFSPKFVMIGQKNAFYSTDLTIAISGMKYLPHLSPSGSPSGATCTWSGSTLSWYGSSADFQFNLASTTYFYFAIG